MKGNFAGNIAWLAAIMAICAVMLLSLFAGTDPLVAAKRGGICGLVVGMVVWLTVLVSLEVVDSGKQEKEKLENEDKEE